MIRINGEKVSGKYVQIAWLDDEVYIYIYIYIYMCVCVCVWIIFYKFELLTWYLSKIISISQKYFLSNSKWLNINQCSSLEQRSFINYLLSDMCAPCEIYRIMYMSEEVCFRQNNVYKRSKHRFDTTTMSRKDSPSSGSTLTPRQRKSSGRSRQ